MLTENIAISAVFNVFERLTNSSSSNGKILVGEEELFSEVEKEFKEKKVDKDEFSPYSTIRKLIYDGEVRSYCSYDNDNCSYELIK
jgi:hypothetical protein